MFADAMARLPPQPAPTPAVEYKQRQDRLTSQFKKDDLFILAAPGEAVHSNDVHYRFRTSSDILYLTGWSDPEASVVIRFDEGCWKTCLFVQPKDTLKEIWEGRRPGVEGALADYAVDEAYPSSELEECLDEWFPKCKRVFHR